MPWFVVGIDGDKTPDPAYWRDRWERIEAKDRHQARRRWAAMREGWLRPEEFNHIFVDEFTGDVNEYFERRDYKRRR